MLPTLQEQLDYLRRIVNPNYIIIVQNKAEEDMDFSRFKAVIPEQKDIYKPQSRYIINHEDKDGRVVITVNDTFAGDREVYRQTCSEGHLEISLKKVKELYKGSSIVDKI